MHEVKLILACKKGYALSFNCDSFEEYEFTYKFNFGPVGCMWSQNLCKSLVKSITKI